MLTDLNNLLLRLYSRAQVARQALRHEEGQALVEYTLILALISVVAIGVLTGIGNEVVKKLGAVETALKGA